jgi:ubiquinone/menaquinone biosynthesis C-methylase UbiE
MTAEVWKRSDVAAAFLDERSLLIPDRPRQLEVLVRLLHAADRPVRRVLDLGTGDGILLATALEALPAASGVGVDFAPLMLDRARQRLAAFGTRAVTAEADLQSPAWRDAVQGPFDAVISGFAIHHLADERKRALYAEVHGLLAAGGVFVNCEHVASPTPALERLFDDAMSEHLFRRRRERGEAVTLEQVRREFLGRPDRAANILAPVEEQCRWLREIGFRDVDCFWKSSPSPQVLSHKDLRHSDPRGGAAGGAVCGADGAVCSAEGSRAAWQEVRRAGPGDPQLARVLEAWPGLSGHVKEAIVALAEGGGSAADATVYE